MSRDDSWGITLSAAERSAPYWESISVNVMDSFCSHFDLPEREAVWVSHSELEEYLHDIRISLVEEPIDENDFITLLDYVDDNPHDNYCIYAWW